MSFDRLVDWMEGRLSEHEARAVEAAVSAADDDTLADVAWLRKFFGATETFPVESPPQYVRVALTDAFEEYAGDRKTTGFLKRMLAALASDSNLQPAMGLRAVGARPSRRQLVYRSEAFDLVLNFLARETDSDLDLDGQVFSREGMDPFSVQLLRDGIERALVTVDELGSFAVRRLPPGRYELVLSSDQSEVSVSPLDVSL